MTYADEAGAPGRTRTLAHTGRRRPTPAGREATDRLNRIHLAIARATPHLPGNFDGIDDFVCPLVLVAISGDRLQTSLGLPGIDGSMKVARHHWARTLFGLLHRASGRGRFTGSGLAFPGELDLKLAFRAQSLLPDRRTPLSARLGAAGRR